MDGVFWLVLFWTIKIIFFIFCFMLFKFAVLTVNYFYNTPPPCIYFIKDA